MAITRHLIVCSLLLSFGAAPTARADEASASEIDPAKRAVIKELITITRMGENIDSMSDLMINQVRGVINTIVQKQIAGDARLSDEKKKEMGDLLSASSDRIISRYRELSKERINMPLIMDQVAYKVYDESFSTAEINDIVAFYRTPTGQKALKELPQIMQRSMSMTSQLVQSQIFEIIKEVTAEEFARLKAAKQTQCVSPETKTPEAKAK